jgi:hypothetical protein
VVDASSHGAVTLQNDKGTLFKVNGQRLKLFLEPNKELEELDVINFFITKVLLGLTFLVFVFWGPTYFSK